MTEPAVEILLVEDDPREVRLTVRELQSTPREVHVEVARDGEEALDFLFCRGRYASRSLQHPPMLVLLDLKLPKIDGLEVLREIKQRPETRTIPVVALTSSSEDQDRARSYQLGVNSYVQKPMDFDQFRDTIQMLGRYWMRFNQAPPESVFSPDSQ